MKTTELLLAWPWTRRAPESWLAIFDTTTPLTSIRVCGAALARPRSPEQVIIALIELGEFEMSALLLQDETFLAMVDAGTAKDLELRVERAVAAAVEEFRSKLAGISGRAKQFEIPCDEQAILNLAKKSSREAMKLLAQVEQDVAEFEVSRVKQLRRRLDGVVAPAGMAEHVQEEWKANIAQAIDLGAVDAAEAAIEAGPSMDLPPTVAVPTPPVLAYRTEPLGRVIGWFFEKGVIPPGFERYIPPASDASGWALLHAIRTYSEQPDAAASSALLSALAAVLECRILRTEFEEGTLLHVDDLSAPALHAFGRRRWPDGIPFWLPAPQDEQTAVAEAVVYVAGSPGARRDSALRISLADVLAVLYDRSHRRARLLAQLGRQLPLHRAFDVMMLDESVRWERQDVPSGLLSTEQPVLLVSAPGMGKSTLLRELVASQEGSVLIDSSPNGELPVGGWILIDGVDKLDQNGLRALIREVLWARSTRKPAPKIVLAGRPETREVIQQLAAEMFSTLELTPRSAAALREQARVMLGWVGIEAAVSGLYDRLAFQASGNPTLLFYLCRALAGVLSNAGTRRRRFDAKDLDKAWHDLSFRNAARDLLWAPLQAQEGATAVLRTIVDFSEPGNPLRLDDLTWAIAAENSERNATWVAQRVRILQGYGLVRVTDCRIGLSLGGIAALVCAWSASIIDSGAQT